MTTHTFYLLSAEIVLLCVALLIYMLSAFVESDRLWGRMAAAGIVAAGVVLACTAHHEGYFGSVAFDRLSEYVRWLALGAGFVLVLMTARPSANRSVAAYTGSLLLIVTGLMVTAVADELVLLFLGLELISIPTYVVLFLGRGDIPAREATAKYFFLSVLASALLLYGFSFLYGLSGGTELEVIRQRLSDRAMLATETGRLAKVALALVFAGLGFKMTAVPFHFYAPDVYQGTLHANAALLSVLPKAAALVAMVRLVIVAMPGMEPYAWRLALLVSLATMTLGNLLGLWQDNLRRLLAYSSIAHTGYMLIGLAAAMSGREGQGAWAGLPATLFYLGLYALATLGTFAAFIYLGRPGRPLETVDELAGLGRTRPLTALWLALFLFSLTGIPPLAGFWGKLAVFQCALNVDVGTAPVDNMRLWFLGLAIIGVINSAVAAAYYLRIVAVMYFRTPLGTPRAEGGQGAWWAALLCAASIVCFSVYAKPLMMAAVEAGTLPASATRPIRNSSPPGPQAMASDGADLPLFSQHSSHATPAK